MTPNAGQVLCEIQQTLVRNGLHHDAELLGAVIDSMRSTPSSETKAADRDAIIEECARAVIGSRVLWDDELPTVGDRVHDALEQVAEQVRRLKSSPSSAAADITLGELKLLATGWVMEIAGVHSFDSELRQAAKTYARGAGPEDNCEVPELLRRILIHEGRRSPPAGALGSGSPSGVARDATPGSAVPGGASPSSATAAPIEYRKGRDEALMDAASYIDSLGFPGSDGIAAHIRDMMNAAADSDGNRG